MPATQTAAVSRIARLLALAASALSIGSVHEAEAATLGAARVAAACSIDLLPLADAVGVSLLCTIPWTEEAAPAGYSWRAVTTVECADGSSMVVYECEAGIWIERIASEADDSRYLSRGFWRDCEPQEAVWFAREAWGC